MTPDLFGNDSAPSSKAGRLPLSPKQSAILTFIRAQKTATLAEITKLTGGNLYMNAEKHTGVTLSGMVKRGLISRIKPGLFAIPA